MYNVTALLNTTDYGEYLRLLNSESNYILGLAFLFSIIVILLISLYKEGLATAAAAAGFIGTVLAIIMFAMGILAAEWIIVPVLLMSGGFIGLWMNRD